jgi:hypothetical protein
MSVTLTRSPSPVAYRLTRHSTKTGAQAGQTSGSIRGHVPPSAALSLLLALAGPAPETWLDHEAACGRLEDQAKAADSADRGATYFAAADECGRAFEKVPAGPKAMDQRSHFVTEAHRLYQQAHDAGAHDGALLRHPHARRLRRAACRAARRGSGGGPDGHGQDARGVRRAGDSAVCPRAGGAGDRGGDRRPDHGRTATDRPDPDLWTARRLPGRRRGSFALPEAQPSGSASASGSG